MSRFALGTWIAEKSGTAFPWHTLAINILGSGLIGLFATTVKPLPWRQFLMVGICGGFTTFSSFSLETFTLFEGGHSARALAYIGLSVLACLGSVWIGCAAGLRFND
ncbi:MAG TPA: CrcB family protein [Bryobacteraceae bacterium]